MLDRPIGAGVRDVRFRTTNQLGMLRTVDVDALRWTGGRSKFDGSLGSLTAVVAPKRCDDGRWRTSLEDADYVETALGMQPEIDPYVALVEVRLFLDGPQSVGTLNAIAAISELEDQPVC